MQNTRLSVNYADPYHHIPPINCDTTFVHMDSLGSFMHIVIFHELKMSPWCPSDFVTLDTVEMGTSGNTCTNSTLELGLYGDDLSHPSSSIDCKYMYSCLVFVFQRESRTNVFHRLTFYRPLKVLRLYQRLLVWICETSLVSCKFYFRNISCVKRQQ